MDARWFILLALIQGALTFSPLPAPDVDGEWDSFMTLMRDSNYRLPETSLPRHYEVTITPYFENVTDSTTAQPFTFDGQVTIYTSVTTANANEIVMHCEDITISTVTVTAVVNGVQQLVELSGDIPQCEMPYALLRINTSTSLVQGQEYIIRIGYTGNLQTNMRGFYRSWYYDSTGKRWMGTTQFQPGHARKAFPCYDEPGFKATFDITVVREADFSPTISNMPLRSNTTLANGRVSETFHTTPLTSTYLLAFIVSHYEVVATTTSITRPFDIYARDNAGSTGDWSLEIGELLLDAMETYTNISYYNMAENMNMKQAAIPDFSAGAMENWGLLTYREALILYDPLNSNHFYRQRVANIVSHEIAHMWFGNLVTCAWWDNLWLNEGFARFYQYYLTGSVAPDMGYDIRFIVEQLHSVMLSDSLESAHALTSSVSDPTSVSAHFSAITYAKGASVLRMTQHFLGESTYVSALRSYLSARQFSVALPEDLFEALQAAADSDNALANYPGITIDDYFKTWSEQAGFPLLTVTIDQTTGQMIVVQARFNREVGTSEIPSLWYVPVTWTRAGSPDFEDLKPSQVLVDQVTVINRGTAQQEWVIFNKQESGYYRVNYDNTNWALITRALRGNDRTVIHELNRAQIVDDVFAMARAGVMTYTRALNILSFLEFEDAYAPWAAAITGFNFMLTRTAYDTENLALLQEEIIRLSSAVTAKLGFQEGSNGTYMDDLQRMYVMEFLCSVGHPQCVSQGVTSFQTWRNGVFLPANSRLWVYCEGLRQGTAEDFDVLWNHYLQEDLASEKLIVLQSLGCSKDNASIFSLLDEIVADNDNVRPQDYSTAIYNAIYNNEENTMIAFEWLRSNINETIEAFESANTAVSYIAARLRTEEQIQEFEVWLEANAAALGSAYTVGVNGVASTRRLMVWSQERIPEIRSYIETGFVDDLDTDENVTTEAATTAVTTTPATPTDVPDSANLATLSIVAFIFTVAINMVL